MLIPLKNRVLVQPDTAPTESESGLLILPDAAHRDPVMSGTVLAVGRGPASAHKVRQATIVRCVRIVEDVAKRTSRSTLCAEIVQALTAYELEPVNLSEIKEGDTVCFPFTVGTEIQVDGQRAILVDEEQLAAVWEPDEVSV